MGSVVVSGRNAVLFSLIFVYNINSNEDQHKSHTTLQSQCLGGIVEQEEGQNHSKYWIHKAIYGDL